MSTDKELVVYSRSTFCPYVQKARRVFGKYDVTYREIMIDQDPEALERVLGWTGYKSVPTIIVANPGEIHPCQRSLAEFFDPPPAAGKSPTPRRTGARNKPPGEGL